MTVIIGAAIELCQVALSNSFSTTRGRVGATICLEVHDFGISDILVSVYHSFSNDETPDRVCCFLVNFCLDIVLYFVSS